MSCFRKVCYVINNYGNIQLIFNYLSCILKALSLSTCFRIIVSMLRIKSINLLKILGLFDDSDLLCLRSANSNAHRTAALYIPVATWIKRRIEWKLIQTQSIRKLFIISRFTLTNRLLKIEYLNNGQIFKILFVSYF